ncbi:unnamed protein product [Dracunculus medinensis]|uniref:UPF0160 protein MYG1, mitochondrial n=1 Tax=Dracunculus medinensis TaxID=318479 RepID=A0A0N4UM47_DRAME|nr:unnamed protein product [Dracunculus medinensis]
MPSIGTHSGKFHCDEVLACSLLRCLSDFKNYEIIRSRNPVLLNKCDIVVDVGGEYDHLKRRYDHHQSSFNHSMKSLNLLDFNTKLSSAGLIYAHYGKKIIEEICGLDQNPAIVEILYEKVYESFVEAVDAIDNGIAQFDGIPRYKLGGTLSDRVNRLNRSWNQIDYDENAKFLEAMNLVQNEFCECLNYYYKTWLPARTVVKKSLENRFQTDESGQIILLEMCVPWTEHFLELEKELSLDVHEITYIVYQDPTSGQWRVQSIPIDKKSAFKNRLPLAESWRGLRDAELSSVAGINGCVFVHMSGFIGGNETRTGALDMARKSLALAGKYKH